MDCVRVWKLVIDEVDLKREYLAEELLSLRELRVLLRPGDGLRWPECKDAEKERVLRLEEGGEGEVEERKGWGDAGLQGRFMRSMEKWRVFYCKREVSKGRKDGLGRGSLPVVKVVQYGALRTEEDPFCVRLTPLSLRRDGV